MVKKQHRYVVLDLEWWWSGAPGWTPALDGKFRCASWMVDGGQLTGTADFSKFAHFMSTLLKYNVTFIGHNITAADLKKCVQWGIRLPAVIDCIDTLIAVRFVHPLIPEKGLKKVGKLYGYTYRDRANISDPHELLEYCGKDTFTAHNLANIYTGLAAAAHTNCALDAYHNMALAFAIVELAGLKMDVARLKKESEHIAEELRTLTPQLPDPEMISNDHLFRSWLLANWHPDQIALLPKSRRGKRETQIGKKYLQLLRPQTPTLEMITHARDLDYHKTLFVDGPLKATSPQGFFFPSYKLLIARTQRRSSEPNIQNWPDKARRAVVSRFRGGQIVSRDFANLEARIFGWQAGCRDFVSALKAGGYIKVAEQCLGITIKDKKDPRYKQVKSTVLAVTYNMRPSLFAFREYVEGKGNVPRMSTAEAQRHYDVLFNRYPELHTEMERRRTHAWNTGTAFSSVGAPIALPLIPDDLLPDDAQWITNYRKKYENWAINYPTQSCAAYVTGCALYDLMALTADEVGGWGRLMELVHASTQGSKVLSWLPIIEVHDCLVCDSRPETKDLCAEAMQEAMTQGKSLLKVMPKFDLSLLDTELKVGSAWDGDPEDYSV